MSPKRAAAAAEKRMRVVAAAGRLLGEQGISAFSLETVAKAAGVTRLTLYNQFGSRRGLLEAVFDERAQVGGLGRLGDAMALADPLEALDRLVEIFSDFWSDPTLAPLYDAFGLDAEFAQAVADRQERRRRLMDGVVARLPSAGARQDTVDLLFALTSYPVFQMLRPGRSTAEVAALVKSACRAALARP
ncbi:TetR family transcriptional regulator [Aliidongia dinghuensis]|uniref:TetR family transcriptional regulator n=1 Tax=Aliidongia dinghuensis TaxID=1867774 RepID=A0A8J3E186_9PROT|nr:TetR/AcrR family transcriptional regulator [Aliidongia dinghuensis]GGF09556.1 TetR family transcriptional regulator [Aliidongia dinghuensis]